MYTSRVVRCASLLILMNSLTVSNSCGGDDMRDPEVRFLPMSEDERQVHQTLIKHIDAAQSLLQDKRLSTTQRQRLQKSVAGARDKLDTFIRRRQQGQTHGTVMMSLGSASMGVLGNDVTIVGVADDWVLLPLAFAAIASDILLQAPASRSQLELAWQWVGTSMRDLGREIDLVGKEIGVSTAQAGLKPRPKAPPAHRIKPRGAERSTVDVWPTVPIPVPKNKEEPRERREECIPKPRCPHKGEDTWHDYCADIVLGNEFPTCDVVVKGRGFDALSGSTLYEVKTDDWDIYADFLTDETLNVHTETAQGDIIIARACGYNYEFVVGDAKLATELSKRLAPLDVVRHEPKCNRKPYKAGETKFGKPSR